MADRSNEPVARPETDKTLTELGRGKAERVVLGNNPLGTMARLVLAIVLFVVVFGSVFYFAQS
jgi:hypothetical protein